jgi:hypothetical protein
MKDIDIKDVTFTFTEGSENKVMEFMERWRKEIKDAPDPPPPKTDIPLIKIDGGYRACSEDEKPTHIVRGCYMISIDEIHADTIEEVDHGKSI